jgi:sugar phosphate permease
MSYFSFLPVLSIRWQVISVLFLATMITFIMRINMSVASLQMALEFNWNENELGYVLSSFYWGYAFGQIPSILLAEKFGGSIILGTSVMMSAALNLLIPSLSKISLISMLILQTLTGLFQAAAFPSCYYLYPRWMPVVERTVMVGFVISGVFLVSFRG